MATGKRGVALLLALLACSGLAAAADRPYRVAVIGNSPPMSYVGENGALTGFNVAIAEALCETLKRRCELQMVPLEKVVDTVAAGEVDFAAVSLLATPERREKVLMSRPYYRSTSLWLAAPGMKPGAPGTVVAAVRGSAQADHVERQGWKARFAESHAGLATLLAEGTANAAVVPMPTALGLMDNPALQAIGLRPTVLDDPLLGGEVCISIDPQQPGLKTRIDAAIDRIKRDGRYDRINTRFLPFRLQ